MEKADLKLLRGIIFSNIGRYLRLTHEKTDLQSLHGITFSNKVRNLRPAHSKSVFLSNLIVSTSAIYGNFAN